MEDDHRRLVEQYRNMAAKIPATEFCRRVLDNGVGPLHAAVLLRDLYGMNLMDCKKAIGIQAADERGNDPAAGSV